MITNENCYRILICRIRGRKSNEAAKEETQFEKSNPLNGVTNLDLGPLMSSLFKKFAKTFYQLMITVNVSTKDSLITLKSEFNEIKDT